MRDDPKFKTDGLGATPSSNVATRVHSADKRAVGVGVLYWVLGAVRVSVFVVMYWLRFPIVSLCNWVATPCLLAWLFSWYAFPEKTQMVWSFAGMSLAAFAVAWLYDVVLMALSPQDTVKVL
jgi:hypothetical protein